MKICVVGGGNLGTLIAAELAVRGHEVAVLTSKPEKFQNTIHVLNQEKNTEYDGKLAKVSDQAGDVIPQSEVIFVTVPSQIVERKLAAITPFVKAGAFVGIVPGSGGGEFYGRELLNRGAYLFGLERVPYIVRLKEYGRSVYNLSTKKELTAACLPGGKTETIRGILEELFQIPCSGAKNYLTITLTPSNPILHTTRLYSMFRDYDGRKEYDHMIRFYEEWDLESSQNLIACDEELQQICKAYDGLDLTGVRSLRVHYESETAQAMTEKISGIPSFRGIEAPMCKGKQGYIPDITSRYFEEDFPYGLCIIKGFAVVAGVETPNIDKVLHWYEKLKQVSYYEGERFCGKDLFGLPLPENFGLDTKQKVTEFYKEQEQEV